MTVVSVQGQLVRSIGFWGLAAVVFNGMIGAGIFALAGSVANFTGSWAPLVIAGVGLALLPVVLVFAALAGLFDKTGGPILYVGAAFGPTAAFQTGWVQCLSTAASTAANANLLADYLMRMGPLARAGAVTHAVIVLAAITTALAINLLEASQSEYPLQNSCRWHFCFCLPCRPSAVRHLTPRPSGRYRKGSCCRSTPLSVSKVVCA